MRQYTLYKRHDCSSAHVDNPANSLMSGSSREVLAMETSHPDHVISFGKKKGCYVSRCVAALLGVFFLSGMVATGLLVYYYAPHIRDSQRESLVLQKPVVSRLPFPRGVRRGTSRLFPQGW